MIISRSWFISTEPPRNWGLDDYGEQEGEHAGARCVGGNVVLPGQEDCDGTNVPEQVWGGGGGSRAHKP